jgi:hypothetical protein
VTVYLILLLLLFFIVRFVDLFTPVPKNTSLPHLFSPGRAINVHFPFLLSHITNNSFIDITNHGDGGAVYLAAVEAMFYGPVYIVQCNFTRCGTKGGYGGAVHVASRFRVNLISCVFQSCLVVITQ